MQTCEDSELVRRRGRWLNHRVMEIFIQEITGMQLLLHMSSTQRSFVLGVAATFPLVLEQAQLFQRAKITTNAWYALMKTKPMAEKMGQDDRGV